MSLNYNKYIIMKLNLEEVAFVQSAVNVCNIKAEHAKLVSSVQVKIEKELERLVKQQEAAAAK